MNFTLPTLIAERRDRSRFVEAVKASPSAPPPAAPLGNSEETQDAAADEHTKTSDNTYCELAEQLRRLECEEAVYFTQKLLIRCVAVEEDAREAIVNEWDAVIQPKLMDAYVALCARSRRHVTQIETTVREKIGASAHHLLRLLHDQRHLEHEEQKERSALACTAMAAMVADHIECPWRSIAPRPPSEGVTKPDEVHAQTNVDADGTWPIVEPTDPLLAVRLLSPEMLELMPKDAVLQRSKCAHDVARDATRNMIHDTNTRAYIVASHYTRERAELPYDDEVKEEVFTTPCSPSCLPGIVLPWSFVEDERNQRLWTSQEWERETAVLDGLLQLFQKVLHTEQTARSALRSLYFWADERRLRATLLLQRAWRYFALQSAGTRRREAIRKNLPSALSQRLKDETVSVLKSHIEGVDDATLRDVWAEDYATGEMGLYYPYRLQVLEVTAERHHRRLYRQFVQSLAHAVHAFVRHSHTDVAADLRRMFFYDEVGGRDEILREQHRNFKAICALEENLSRVLRGVPEDAPRSLPRVLEQIEAPPVGWEAIYEDDRRAEWRRVALCANGWRHFRLEQHKLVFDMEENDAYIALVSQRGGSASTSARPPSSERIPSAGYRRVPSAGYSQGRVVSSGGAERIGSAAYRRLGSASINGPRRGSSADTSRVRLPPPTNAQLGVPRFWEGYQKVIYAKQRIALLEALQRESIEELYERHVHYASIAMTLLVHHPNQWRVDVPHTFASEVSALVQREVSDRALLVEDVDTAAHHFLETAASLATSAYLSRIVPPREAVADEQEARRSLESQEATHRNEVTAIIKSFERTFAAATEHLRKIGIIPRPASSRAHARLTSALQRDDLEHHRVNFATAGRVATVIQRWWRHVSSKRLHVIDAALVVIDQRTADAQRHAFEVYSAQVIQQQLAALSDEQTLQRRTSSASTARQSRPPSSARASSAARRIGDQTAAVPGRPQSAISNLHGAPQESMRTVLSRRSLQPQLFVQWAVAEQEETSSRAEWALIEAIQRNHLESAFASILMTALIQPKLARVEERMEPANRLRIEREALHSFVSLFFCPPAESIRVQAVLDKETLTREALLREERVAWHEIAARTSMLGDTIRACHRSTSSKPLATPDIEPMSARAFVLKTKKQIDAQITRRSTVGAPVVRETTTPTARLLWKEDVNRTAVEQEYVALTRSAFADYFIDLRRYEEQQTYDTWRSLLLTSATVFDDSRTHCAEFRIFDAYRIGLEQRTARALMERAAVDSVAAVLDQAHTDFVHVMWREEQRRWRHYHASMALSTVHFVAESLEIRLAHSASKLNELLALEDHARQIIQTAEEFRRDSDELTGASYAVVKAAIWRSYYH